jgi:hypothetical protein
LEIRVVLITPISMKLGVVVSRIVGDYDHTLVSHSAATLELPKKLPAGLTIEAN